MEEKKKGTGYSRKCAQFTVDQSYAGEGYLTSVPWWKWDEKIIQRSIYLVIPCYSQEWLTLPRRFFGKAHSQLPPPDLQNLNLHFQRDSHVIHRNIKFWESKWHPYSFNSCWGLRVPDTWNTAAISSLGQRSPASAGSGWNRCSDSSPNLQNLLKWGLEKCFYKPSTWCLRILKFEKHSSRKVDFKLCILEPPEYLKKNRTGSSQTN